MVFSYDQIKATLADLLKPADRIFLDTNVLGHSLWVHPSDDQIGSRKNVLGDERVSISTIRSYVEGTRKCWRIVAEDKRIYFTEEVMAEWGRIAERQRTAYERLGFMSEKRSKYEKELVAVMRSRLALENLMATRVYKPDEEVRKRLEQVVIKSRESFRIEEEDSDTDERIVANALHASMYGKETPIIITEDHRITLLLRAVCILIKAYRGNLDFCRQALEQHPIRTIKKRWNEGYRIRFSTAAFNLDHPFHFRKEVLEALLAVEDTATQVA